MSTRYERSYGSKYNGKLSRVEIAKLVRKEISAKVKAGELPKGKYSVTCSRGRAIDVDITNLEGFNVVNPEYNPKEAEIGWNRRASNEAQTLLDTVKSIVNAYNYDGSDSQSDYFDVNFYGHVTFGWEWFDAQVSKKVAA